MHKIVSISTFAVHLLFFSTVAVGSLGYVILALLCCASAVVMFANYLTSGCDPLAAGDIYSPNQVSQV